MNLEKYDSPEYQKLDLCILLSIESPQPIEVLKNTFIYSLVPIDRNLDGSVLLVNSSDPNEKYECRINEVIPSLKYALRIRISTMAERFLNKRLAEFADLLEQTKNNR